MLAYTVANMCKKVFVIVPSDALRSQTFKKFKELGILKELEVIPHDIQLPIVRKVSTIHSEEEWVDIIDSSNVIITTMASAENIPNKIRLYLKEKISILFVDEAHHSKAETRMRNCATGYWTDALATFIEHIVLRTSLTQSMSPLWISMARRSASVRYGKTSNT